MTVLWIAQSFRVTNDRQAPILKKNIKILILDDNRLLRDGLTVLLKDLKDITVLATPGVHEGPLPLIRRLKPHVILLDLGLRGHNSLHIVEVVSRELPKSGIIVMDLAPASGDVLRFIRSGASGFILKDASPDEFIATIHTVIEGGKVLPPLLSGSVFSQIVDNAIMNDGVGIMESVKMTKREREVLSLISDGMTNKQIALKLHITPYTVKSHIHNIMEKLALHTRLEVANYALARKIPARKV